MIKRKDFERLYTEINQNVGQRLKYTVSRTKSGGRHRVVIKSNDLMDLGVFSTVFRRAYIYAVITDANRLPFSLFVDLRWEHKNRGENGDTLLFGKWDGERWEF